VSTIQRLLSVGQVNHGSEARARMPAGVVCTAPGYAAVETVETFRLRWAAHLPAAPAADNSAL
jgi:hypothetical protein